MAKVENHHAYRIGLEVGARACTDEEEGYITFEESLLLQSIKRAAESADEAAAVSSPDFANGIRAVSEDPDIGRQHE